MRVIELKSFLFYLCFKGNKNCFESCAANLANLTFFPLPFVRGFRRANKAEQAERLPETLNVINNHVKRPGREIILIKYNFHAEFMRH